MPNLPSAAVCASSRYMLLSLFAVHGCRCIARGRTSSELKGVFRVQTVPGSTIEPRGGRDVCTGNTGEWISIIPSAAGKGHISAHYGVWGIYKAGKGGPANLGYMHDAGVSRPSNRPITLNDELRIS